MPHLICYDIANNNLRTRLAAKIAAAGFDRINKSVYLGTVSDRSLAILQAWLQKQMQTKAQEGDCLIILPVTTQQVQRMLVLGTDQTDREELTGSKNTIFI